MPSPSPWAQDTHPRGARDRSPSRWLGRRGEPDDLQVGRLRRDVRWQPEDARAAVAKGDVGRPVVTGREITLLLKRGCRRGAPCRRAERPPGDSRPAGPAGPRRSCGTSRHRRRSRRSARRRQPRDGDLVVIDRDGNGAGREDLPVRLHRALKPARGDPHDGDAARAERRIERPVGQVAADGDPSILGGATASDEHDSAIGQQIRFARRRTRCRGRGSLCRRSRGRSSVPSKRSARRRIPVAGAGGDDPTVRLRATA